MPPRIWYVLHVKPRCEKKVFRWLEILRCFRHLPLYEKIRKVQRRKIRRELPLFPGYVFSRLTPEERLVMYRTDRLVSAIVIKKPRETIHQLRQIRRASRGGAQLRAMAKVFKEGDLVRVVSGPFRGTEGRLVRDGAGTALCLNVTVLGASALMKISPDDVEKTGE